MVHKIKKLYYFMLKLPKTRYTTVDRENCVVSPDLKELKKYRSLVKKNKKRKVGEIMIHEGNIIIT